MSDPTFFNEPDTIEEPEAGAAAAGPRRRGKPKRFRGCLPMLVVLAVFVAGGWWAFGFVTDQVREWTSGPEDYPGPGTGEVAFEVQPGQSVASMGQDLEGLDVVASSEAFVAAARALPPTDTQGIQVGVYLMREQMAAADAIGVLVDPANLVQTAVTVPEGMTVDQIVDRLAAETEFGKGRYRRALDDPAGLGLPDYAGGDAEGYLFPATYPVTPTDTPESILAAMVDRWRQSADSADLETRAAELGYEPQEIMTIASLVEAEATPPYMPQVARVIYNRIEEPGAGTNGLLQLDATVNYAHGNNLGARTTEEERQIDSPYNTYRYAGLPPGPIEAPGDAAIEAALNPAEGDWFYYVTVNLATGETKFAETLTEHNQYAEELNEYCRNESERC